MLSVSKSFIALEWKKPSFGAGAGLIGGYMVRLSCAGSQQKLLVSANNTNATISTLESNTNYSISVSVYSSFNESGVYSEPVVAVTRE